MADCAENGLLVLAAGSHVIRLAPPLNISAAEIKHGLALLEKTIGEWIKN